MRRTTAILTVCLCAVAGCEGGAAQEPYDGVIAATRRPVSASIAGPQAPEAASIEAEVDVPWSIALLSDAKRPRAKNGGKVIVVGAASDVPPETPETIADEAGFHVAVGPRPSEEKPTTPKTCSGVVKTRS
jgi:hypothetical protein